MSENDRIKIGVKEISVEQKFEEKLDMYTHIKNIRDKLWTKDGKSRVSVMIGAGFSLNANMIESSLDRMSIWTDIKSRLLEDLKHHHNIEYKSVLEIGQIYVKEYGRSSLDEILKKSIPDENYEPGDIHYSLLNLPWSDIYTTNYDTLLERTRQNIYQQSYQVIYGINDIPNSVQPRIIKLHGSFPSTRPFIFTQEDYDNYEKQFSPFINMVQQSIMETTFVLIGFSGDDPNFEKWTNWVAGNLGHHMPKIYMFGYKEKHRLADLDKKGITLIDFEGLYDNLEDAYLEMFKDIFSYLSYDEKINETNWPYEKFQEDIYSENVKEKLVRDIEKFKKNRLNYPGWAVLPENIRRLNSKAILDIGRTFFRDLDFNYEDNVEKKLENLNEILWAYQKFSLPLERQNHEILKRFIDSTLDDNNDYFMPLLFLLREAKLNFEHEEFKHYFLELEKLKLVKEQRHILNYERMLYYLNIFDLESFKNSLNEWEVEPNEIEWATKKAIAQIRADNHEEAILIFHRTLKVIRKVLAIKQTDFYFLSLEGIIIYHLDRISNDIHHNQRLNKLRELHCDSNWEFNELMRSIQKYESKLGKKTTQGFDIKTRTVSVGFGDYMNQELIDSYYAVNLQEYYGFSIKNESQYNWAIDNLGIFYDFYPHAKKINFATVKKLDDSLTRENIYNFSGKELKEYITISKKILTYEYKNNIIESLSRIYFILNNDLRVEIDALILKVFNEKRIKYIEDRIVLEHCVKRMIDSKNKQETIEFVHKLFEINIEFQSDFEGVNAHLFFEPFLYIVDKTELIYNIQISKNILEDLIRKLVSTTTNVVIKESTTIRLTFLAITKSLPEEHLKTFISYIKSIRNENNRASRYIHDFVFDKLISSTNKISLKKQTEILQKDIPYLKRQGIMRDLSELKNYFSEIKEIFPDYVISINQSIPSKRIYKNWIDKFFEWWDQVAEYILRLSQDDRLLPTSDFLELVINILRNHILGVIPSSYLNDKEKNKFLVIFREIDSYRPDLSIFLIPGLSRLNLVTSYTLEDILNKTFDNQSDYLSENVLYDYLVFIAKDEIQDPSNIIKETLINILKYSDGRKKITSIQTLIHTFKHTENIFNINEQKQIAQYANFYLVNREKRHSEVYDIEDIELLIDWATLVIYLLKINSDFIQKDLKNWIYFISNNDLAEIRNLLDILNNDN